MSRTVIDLRDDLIRKAKKLTGLSKKVEIVNLALEHLIRQMEIEEIFKKQNPKKISKLDGISVEFNDWWFNVRPSNTEPLLRLNLEADSEKLMDEKKKELLGIMER